MGFRPAGGRAVGVKLKRNPNKKSIIKAKKAVISNASLWDTQKLLPKDAVSQKWSNDAQRTNMTGSFMHLHLGLTHSCWRGFDPVKILF